MKTWIIHTWTKNKGQSKKARYVTGNFALADLSCYPRMEDKKDYYEYVSGIKLK